MQFLSSPYPSAERTALLVTRVEAEWVEVDLVQLDITSQPPDGGSSHQYWILCTKALHNLSFDRQEMNATDKLIPKPANSAQTWVREEIKQVKEIVWFSKTRAAL